MTIPQQALVELCGAPPGAFVAARDAWVKTLKAQKQPDAAAAVKALKKPSVPLWALNALAREHPTQANAWLAVGNRLMAAQADALRPDGAAALRDAMRAQKELLVTLLDLVAAMLKAAQQTEGYVDRVRPLLLALHGAPAAVGQAFSGGTLLEEPQAADVGDMLSLMVGSAAPALAVSAAQPGVTNLAAHRVATRDKAEQEAKEREAQAARRAALRAALDERIKAAIVSRQQVQQRVVALQQEWTVQEQAAVAAEQAARVARTQASATQEQLLAQQKLLSTADQALKVLTEELGRL
jgi:hypothetical protein